MKIASYKVQGLDRFGLLDASEQGFIDCTESFVSLRQVLANGQLVALQDWCAGKAADHGIDEVRFSIPVPDARRIICIGRNYDKIHPVEGKLPPPDNISLFAKLPGSCTGHRQPLIKTPVSDTYDYEGEICMVIGQRCRNLSVDQAPSVIAGFTILNDGSVREWQRHSVTAGKNFESASSIGPWMATMDAVRSQSQLDQIHMRTWLNEHCVQDVHASEMLFNISTILSYVSGFTTLEPGDIVATGSPERESVPGRDNPYLQDGDVVDIQIDGVGRLSNPVQS